MPDLFVVFVITVIIIITVITTALNVCSYHATYAF